MYLFCWEEGALHKHTCIYIYVCALACRAPSNALPVGYVSIPLRPVGGWNMTLSLSGRTHSTLVAVVSTTLATVVIGDVSIHTDLPTGYVRLLLGVLAQRGNAGVVKVAEGGAWIRKKKKESNTSVTPVLWALDSAAQLGEENAGWCVYGLLWFDHLFK